MSESIGDRLRRARRATFVGRAAELAQLEACVADDGPAVTFVHGIGGIGKSALLEALLARLGERGVPVLRLEGGAIEPTRRGLLDALGEALGRAVPSPAAASEALGALRPVVLVAIDDYERLRLLDGWLRRELVPALPAHVRLLFVGRSAPVAAWAAAPGWRALMRTLHLGPLDDAAARALLERVRIDAADAERIQRFAHGHPLALELAAAAVRERPALPVEEVGRRRVVDALARRFLQDVRDPATRRALEAAAVVRRATRPVLAAMLGEAEADDALDRLRGLSFVEPAADGLAVHPSVRQAVEGGLRATDPARHRDLRRAAWGCLRRELEVGGRGQRWRHTADVLYLVDHASIREAFFPTDDHVHAVEQAVPSDRGAVVAITERFDGPAGARAVEAWWDRAPEAFHVVRDRDGEPCGYYALTTADRLDDALCAADPVAARSRAHLREAPVPTGQPVLLARRMLAADAGEAPSAVRAACWLDAKRLYLENAAAARIYFAVADVEGLLPPLAALEFRHRPALAAPVADGRPLETLTLDFGPGGILDWLARLVDAQYEAPPPPCRLDEDTRELVVDAERVRLTPLEFRLLAYLMARPGRVVDRDELLREVWEQSYGGSNVVDVVVRGLRKKLGARAGALETVRGFGYRFVGFEPGTG